MTKSFLLTLFSLLITSTSFSQGPLAVLNAEADSLLNEKAYAKAAPLYEQVLKNKEAEQVWNNFRLGQCYRHLEQNDKAMKAYRRSIAVGNNPYAMFQMGMLFASADQLDSAFHHLNEAVKGGLTIQSYYEDNEALEPHHEDPRYAQLLKEINKLNRPCQYEPKARQFDFWIGQWKVYNTGGIQVGSSVVERILDDCVIFENWTNSRDNQGKSFNMYDAAAGIWRQTWVDQNGSWTEFRGNWDGEHMRVTTDDQTDPNTGKTARRRMTFTPLKNGYVRQHGEQSFDEGKTWVTTYDLEYRK